MFDDQWLGISGSARQCRQSRRIADVAECDADVAQQPASLGAQDRGACKPLFKSGLVQGEQLQQIHLIEAWPVVRLHQSAIAREAVPGTNVQAIVAAIDSISDRAAEFHWDGTFELDREIRDATTSIELKWRGERAGRAGFKALCA